MPQLDDFFQFLLVAEVNLIDKHQHGYGHLAHLLQKVLVLVGLFHHVGDVEQHVGILQRRLGEGEHGLLQFVVGLKDTGRVGEDNLHVVGVENAHDAVARGLRLEGGDRNALAHKEVHERGLADVRVAHDVYETGFVHLVAYLNLVTS